MNIPQDILLSAIRGKRPLILLLGEDAWSEENAVDPVLSSALSNLKSNVAPVTGWIALFSDNHLSNDKYSWLTERFDRRVDPPFIDILKELPWSAVFTSSIDPTLPRLFSNRGREVEPILTANEHPRVSRSTIRPPLYYLFSRAGELDPNAQPPNSRMALISRRNQHAIPLLNRIRETATPVGTIVVDGIMQGDGWLRFEDVLAALSNATSNQILWFGGKPSLRPEDSAHFDELQLSGHILVEEKRLGTVAAELRATGRIEDVVPLESDDAGRVTFADGGSYQVPPDVRLRVEAAASIVDDSWTSFLPPFGQDAIYEAFRRFHGGLGGPRLLVEGIRRGFSIERDFETGLSNRVNTALTDHAKLDSPIIVDGQSGTGKSIALARIVAKVREAKSAAVLYSIGRIPQSHDVDAFCQAVERSTNQITLIVCDANGGVDNYDELLSGLRSRGRRAVVVGSQYRSGSSNGTDYYARVGVSTELSIAERNHLRSLFVDFGVAGHMELAGDNFLALLYRYLPASRRQIGSGLGAEARMAVRQLGERGNRPQPVRVFGQLHQQMIECGLVDPEQSIFQETSSNDGYDEDGSAGKIVDMVMVAGRLNCPVPFNLLLRAVTDEYQRIDSDLISELFGDLDLIRWESRDPEGHELVVQPRLQLEARLICERRLLDAQAEATVLIDLIGSVRLGIDSAHEREFLLHLLQQIGSDGPRGAGYKTAYVDFARKLTWLRKRFNVMDASLMLQESVFRRSAVREEAVDYEKRFELLEEAREAIQVALDAVGTGQIRAARRTQQNLRVELAALHGFLATDRAKRHESPAAVWAAYQAARVAVVQAVGAADNYYPHDVGLWTPVNLFESADLTDSQRAELAADMYSTLDQVERESLAPSQTERFQRRRMTVGAALKDHALTDDAYRELAKSGSTAGYFLRARQYAPELDNDAVEVARASDIDKAKRAAEFLDAHMGEIQHDQRCLWLLLENRWISELRRRPLRGERQPLPYGDARRRFLNIVRTLNEAAADSARYGTRYLEAVLTWLTGDYPAAQEIFRALYQETDNVYRGRIIARNVVSDAQGHPLAFSGRVEEERGEGRWRIRVSEFGQTIVLRERDFPHENIAYGRTLTGVGLAFNFIGPIADPIRR